MKRTGKICPKDPLERILWTCIVTVAAAVMVSSSSFVLAGTFDAWDFSMKITFSGYDPPGGGETLTNFPSLVVLSTNIDNFSYSDFYSASGTDLRFAASNETTELNYEIEEWDTNGTSWVWVQVPELAGTNDFIYAYLGMNTNAPSYTTNGATWSNGYAGVWHLKEEQSGTGTADLYKDSTSNTNHGDDYVSATGQIGRVNGAQEFDGDDDYVEVGDHLTLDMTNKLTVATWLKQPSPAADNAFVAKWYYNTQGTWAYQTRSSNPDEICGYIANALTDAGVNYAYTTDANMTTGEWHHVVWVYDGSGAGNSEKLKVYVNGKNKSLVFIGTIASSLQDSSASVNIGKFGGSLPRCFNGIIDEVRISSVARSSNWIWACWMNQGSNDVFMSYGTAAPNTTNLTVLTRPASEISPTNAVLNGKVWLTGDAENPYVYFCWDYSDKGTSSTGVWGNVGYMGTNWGKDQLFATNVTGLLSGSNYTYRCYVTNSTGEDWSDDARSFTTIYLPSATNTGATNVFRQVATLRGEITDTGGDTPQVWFYYWLGSSTSTVAMGLQNGAFFKQVTDLFMDSTYYYKILASNMAGTVWSSEKSFITLPFGTGTNIWSGAGVTSNWFEHANWTAGGTPLAGEHVIITNKNVLLTDSTPGLASFTITNATLTFTNWVTTLTASNMTLHSGGTITIPPAFTESQMSNRVHIVCASFMLASGGTIDADERGYSGINKANGYGPGGGLVSGDGGTGGGYGGKGGKNQGGIEGGSTYGSTNAPVDPGSAGGGYSIGGVRGGSGGGSVRIEADSLTINGTITANGQDGVGNHDGGGSGGAIWITCEEFTGSTNGILRANGGDGVSTLNASGGGGGGRIAVWYGVPDNRIAGILDGTDMRRVSIITNASDYSKFAGTVSVTNGTGYTNLPPGGAECGTCIFLTVTPPSGTVFMAR